MKKLIYVVTLVHLTLFNLLSAWNVSVSNSVGDGAFGLFDENGTLVDGSTTENIRIGSFNSFDAQSAWDVGDLSAIDSNFAGYGDSFGMNDFNSGVNGIFENAIDEPVAAGLEGDSIVLWATNGGAFTASSAQHLIYEFDKVFPEEPAGPSDLTLGVDNGSFIAGEFGNFSNDFGMGGGEKDGFNTVSAVPEPSTYAALVGLCVFVFVSFRRRR
ncbi:MAG: PEP-CTERM sorting domain-containing protein [Opitutales bacterium]